MGINLAHPPPSSAGDTLPATETAFCHRTFTLDDNPNEYL